MKWQTDSLGGLTWQPKPHRDAGDAAFDNLAAEIDKDMLPAKVLALVVASPTAVATDPPGLAKCETFPVAHVAEVFITGDPMAKMKTLCRDLLIHKNYPRIRNEYCRLSISLNLIGKLAPAFRPVLKSGAEYNHRTIHHQVHRDQLVIDLHWCHANKMKFSSTDPNHQVLFDDPAVFPFDWAYVVAGKNLTSKYRAAQALCLTTLQQCQLLKLREATLVSRQKALYQGWLESDGKTVSKIAAANRQIGQWAERDKRIASSRDHYEKLWLARELLEPDAKAAQIGALHALMVGGVELNRRTIFGQLKQLDKYIKRPAMLLPA